MAAQRIIGLGLLLGLLAGCTAVSQPAEPIATPTTSSIFSAGQATSTPAPLPTIPPLITVEAHENQEDDTAVIPILLYHHIGVPAEDGDKYLSITTDNFRDQMAFLARNDYQTLTLDDLTAILTHKQEAPSNPVILTFDDGFRDQYENAVPILQEYGFTATFFITTELIESGSSSYMTWDLIKELPQAGMRIESQSMSDAPLAGLDQAAMMAEVRGAQAALTAQIGEAPHYLAYPFGAYDDLVLETAASAGLAGALTTNGSKAHSFARRFEWGRIPVAGDWTLADFAEQVRPAAAENAPDGERDTAVVVLFDDELHPNWQTHAAPGMKLSLEAVSHVHSGIYALSISPLTNNDEEIQGRPEITDLEENQLAFRVSPETTDWYRPDRLAGISFWLNTGLNQVEPGDMTLIVTGSNIQPFWAKGDESAGGPDEIETFSGKRAYSLGIEHTVPPETWVEVYVSLEELVYDPDQDNTLIEAPEYAYFTGFYLVLNNVKQFQPFYIDDVELVVAER